MVAAPRLALGTSSFAERCSVCLSYAAVAAREGLEPPPEASNNRLPYQLGDLAAVRKERESNPQGLRSPGFQPGAVADRLALPYAARSQSIGRRASFAVLLYSAVKVRALAGRAGLEPATTVLETAMLPLHHRPVLVWAAGFEPALTAVRRQDVVQATPRPYNRGLKTED